VNTSTIRVGVAGLDGDSPQILSAVLAHPGFTVTAVTELEASAAETIEAALGARALPGIEAMCSSPEVDVIILGTANRHRNEHGALAAGNKHVIFDKLVATSMEGCERTLVAAERAGKYIGVAEPHGSSAAVRSARQVIESGDLGALRMVHSWVYYDWAYRPRTQDELNPDLPEGVLFRQGPHQFDAIRVLGGGQVKTVRGIAGGWDAARRMVGAYTAYLTFEDGSVATAVCNGYDHFFTGDLALTTSETASSPRQYGQARRALAGRSAEDEAAMVRPQSAVVEGMLRPARSGGSRSWPTNGPMIASCDRGDIVLSPDGVVVYGEMGIETLASSAEHVGAGDVVNQLYEAITTGRQPTFSGEWGQGTLEVILAVAQSGREDREVSLSKQTALGRR
jgi:phthalate 4,5-cis-dihydrodiol dehydrogenase